MATQNTVIGVNTGLLNFGVRSRIAWLESMLRNWTNGRGRSSSLGRTFGRTYIGEKNRKRLNEHRFCMTLDDAFHQNLSQLNTSKSQVHDVHTNRSRSSFRRGFWIFKTFVCWSSSSSASFSSQDLGYPSGRAEIAPRTAIGKEDMELSSVWRLFSLSIPLECKPSRVTLRRVSWITSFVAHQHKGQFESTFIDIMNGVQQIQHNNPTLLTWRNEWVYPKGLKTSIASLKPSHWTKSLTSSTAAGFEFAGCTYLDWIPSGWNQATQYESRSSSSSSSMFCSVVCIGDGSFKEDAQNCRIHEGTSSREKVNLVCNLGLSSTTSSTRHSTTTFLHARETLERVDSSVLEDMLLCTIHCSATDGTAVPLLPAIVDTFPCTKTFRLTLACLVSVLGYWCL